MRTLTTLTTVLALLAHERTRALPVPTTTIALPEADSAPGSNAPSASHTWHTPPNADSAAPRPAHPRTTLTNAEQSHRRRSPGRSHDLSLGVGVGVENASRTDSRSGARVHEACTPLMDGHAMGPRTRLAAARRLPLVSSGEEEEEEEEEDQDRAWGATVERRGIERRIMKIWFWTNPWVDLWCDWFPSWCHEEPDD